VGREHARKYREEDRAAARGRARVGARVGARVRARVRGVRELGADGDARAAESSVDDDDGARGIG